MTYCKIEWRTCEYESNCNDANCTGCEHYVDDETIELINKTHQGFTIQCDECKSILVKVDIDVGFSGISGGWGGVHLVCLNCDKTTTVWNLLY